MAAEGHGVLRIRFRPELAPTHGEERERDSCESGTCFDQDILWDLDRESLAETEDPFLCVVGVELFGDRVRQLLRYGAERSKAAVVGATGRVVASPKPRDVDARRNAPARLVDGELGHDLLTVDELELDPSPRCAAWWIGPYPDDLQARHFRRFGVGAAEDGCAGDPRDADTCSKPGHQNSPRSPTLGTVGSGNLK